MTQLPNGIITMILDMVPRDSHYKHPVAVMLKASKANGRLTRWNNVLKSDNFYLLRSFILRNHHKKDLMENRENPNNYKSVLKSGEMSRYLGGTDTKFNRMFEMSVRSNKLCFII